MPFAYLGNERLKCNRNYVRYCCSLQTDLNEKCKTYIKSTNEKDTQKEGSK